MITAAHGKSLSLAGLMPPCSGFKTLAKLSFLFTNEENYFPRISGGMNHIATSDGRAAWDFETSTREFKDTLANCRTVTREFSGTLEARFVTSTRDGCHTCSKEFCESIKKGLMCPAIPVYGYSAPAKSGAGIGVLVKLSAIHDAPSVFFVSLAQYTLFSAVRCHSVLASELWWAGRGLLRKRRFPITPVTPTLSSPSPVKLAFPVMGLIPSYRRLPHAGYYPYPKTAIYLDYRRCSPRYAEN